jgi:hypothetical protein
MEPERGLWKFSVFWSFDGGHEFHQSTCLVQKSDNGEDCDDTEDYDEDFCPRPQSVLFPLSRTYLCASARSVQGTSVMPFPPFSRRSKREHRSDGKEIKAVRGWQRLCLRASPEQVSHKPFFAQAPALSIQPHPSAEHVL